MDSGQNIDRIVSRCDDIHKDVIALVDYAKLARCSLGLVDEVISTVVGKLGSIDDSTERAGHRLLGLVEKALDSEEVLASGLRDSLTSQGDSPPEQALKKALDISESQNELLMEILTELSFQDLTCQALQRVQSELTSLQTKRLRNYEADVDDVTEEFSDSTRQNSK